MIWPILMQFVPSCRRWGRICKCSYHAVEDEEDESIPLSEGRVPSPLSRVEDLGDLVPVCLMCFRHTPASLTIYLLLFIDQISCTDGSTSNKPAQPHSIMDSNVTECYRMLFLNPMIALQKYRYRTGSVVSTTVTGRGGAGTGSGRPSLLLAYFEESVHNKIGLQQFRKK